MLVQKVLAQHPNGRIHVLGLPEETTIWGFVGAASTVVCTSCLYLCVHIQEYCRGEQMKVCALIKFFLLAQVELAQRVSAAILEGSPHAQHFDAARFPLGIPIPITLYRSQIGVLLLTSHRLVHMCVVIALILYRSRPGVRLLTSHLYVRMCPFLGSLSQASFWQRDVEAGPRALP